MKLVGTSCKSNEISQNSLGDTTCFLHEDHKKALSPRTAIVEMEIQRKSELVDTSCKSNEISQNGLGDTTCFLHRPFQIPEQPAVEKTQTSK